MRVEIVNWGKYQPRKDYKSTPWLRLDNKIINDFKISQLSPAEKWLWITILALAATENNSSFETSVEHLAKIADIEHNDTNSGLKKLSNFGMITTDERDTNGYVRDTFATNERTNETNERTDRSHAPQKLKITPDEIIDIWNTELSPPLPKCVGLSATQMKKMLEVFPQLPTKEKWVELFVKIKGSEFLMGQTEKKNAWRVTLTWLCDISNVMKVLNGEFENTEEEYDVEAMTKAVEEKLKCL